MCWVSMPDGQYILYSGVGSNQLLVVEDGATYSGANVQLHQRSAAHGLRFNVALSSGGAYTVSQAGSEMPLAIAGGDCSPGANVVQEDVADSAGSQWVFEDAGDGLTYIRSLSGLYFDVDEGLAQDDVNVKAWKFNGSAAQKFTFKSVARVPRYAGDSAVQTSAAISQAAFPSSSEWVVIARDDDFADAMSATGLAGVLDAPIVLTDRFGLSEEARAEIARLKPSHAYVIGGNVAMPGDFEGELSLLGVDAQRLFGYEAYDTSVACAQEIVAHGGSADKAIIAYGQDFSDALSMSSFAYKYGVPIFLQTFGDTSVERGLTDDAVAMLTGEGVFANANVFVAGGLGAVSDESLVPITADNRSVVRLAGYDGYDTSNQIALWMTSHGDAADGAPYLDPATVCIACGAAPAKGVDALSGAALAGRAGGVMLLASSNPAYGVERSCTLAGTDSEGSAAFLTAHAGTLHNVSILGGMYVVPERLEDLVVEALEQT